MLTSVSIYHVNHRWETCRDTCRDGTGRNGCSLSADFKDFAEFPHRQRRALNALLLSVLLFQSFCVCDVKLDAVVDISSLALCWLVCRQGADPPLRPRVNYLHCFWFCFVFLD